MSVALSHGDAVSNLNEDSIIAVPTNIITGFLGVGKTTAILHLLKSKPRDERWAVLVNEFGEIGVDGSLFAGDNSVNEQVYIREVPGGCMCCAAGLPMQIALNQLLVQAKPDRLLIEPTGLGHPIEIIQVLSEQHYKNVLELHQIITLVDARKLSSEKYVSNSTFNQQLKVADTIVANKQDLYNDNDKSKLRQYSKKYGFSAASIKLVEQGALDLDWLSGLSSSASRIGQRNAPTFRSHHPVEIIEKAIPESGFFCAKNKGEGFNSEGWRVSPEIVFCKEKLLTWLYSLDVERLKAVFITNEGIFGFNLSDHLLSQVEIDECFESRLEIIYSGELGSFEGSLKGCIDE